MIEPEKLLENEQFLKKLNQLIEEKVEQKLKAATSINKKDHQISTASSSQEGSMGLPQALVAIKEKSDKNQSEWLAMHEEKAEQLGKFIEDFQKRRQKTMEFIGLDDNTNSNSDNSNKEKGINDAELKLNQQDDQNTQEIVQSSQIDILGEKNEIESAKLNQIDPSKDSKEDNEDQIIQIETKKQSVISSLNDVLSGIARLGVEREMRSMFSSLEGRLSRCEKSCLDKLVNSNGSSHLHNQNLESISKNFSTIHSEIKKINQFLDVIQEEQQEYSFLGILKLHLKLKIEENYQNTKKNGNHNRVKSFQGQPQVEESIPEALVLEMSIMKSEINAKDQQIKNLEVKIINVHSDCFRLEQEIDDQFKIHEEKVVNIWQSISFITENITDITKKLEKKKGLFF